MVPDDMKHLINYDEKVEWVLKGNEVIVVSDQRIIMRKSGGLGLKRSFVDYPYTNMINIRLDRGLRKASVEILMRSGVQSIKIENLSKGDAYQLHRILRENIVHASGSHIAQPFPVILQPQTKNREIENEDETCVKCKRKVSPDYSICPYCKQPLKIECPECGKRIDRRYKTCPYCAEDLSYLAEMDLQL